MKSRTTDTFWKEFDRLPLRVQAEARDAYRKFRDDPYYYALNFKRVHTEEAIYSVRIGIKYRALGRIHRDQIIWFWIGIHDVYEKILRGH